MPGVLAHAASTVERMPPTFRDEATGLRAAALIVLNEVDETLAAFHATRLLVDEFADPMSGEPSVTAARVLASQDNLLPLYLLVSQAAPPVSPDALSECLRSLTSLPVGLLPALVERYSGTTSAAVLAGLYDLLVSHRAGPQALPFLEREPGASQRRGPVPLPADRAALGETAAAECVGAGGRTIGDRPAQARDSPRIAAAL